MPVRDTITLAYLPSVFLIQGIRSIKKRVPSRRKILYIYTPYFYSLSKSLNPAVLLTGRENTIAFAFVSIPACFIMASIIAFF